MLLQTNSYVVPKEKRSEHARLIRRFRQTLGRLGCDQFDVFEQVGPNWGAGETTGRFVQMMRFRDRKHQLAVQTAEKQDPAAQELIQEFCNLINFGYQQQQGLFAVGYYQSVLPVAPPRLLSLEGEQTLIPLESDAQSDTAPAHVADDGPHDETATEHEPLPAEAEIEIEHAPTAAAGVQRVDEADTDDADDDALGTDDLELEADLSDTATNREDRRPPSTPP